MPALLTGATIAHECLHALLRMRGLRSRELSDFVEEGLAQLMSLLYLQHCEEQVRQGIRTEGVRTGASAC